MPNGTNTEIDENGKTMKYFVFVSRCTNCQYTSCVILRRLGVK